ncbi:MAG: nuclear transport factor 2 family protein [Bacteroidota bacterium]
MLKYPIYMLCLISLLASSCQQPSEGTTQEDQKVSLTDDPKAAEAAVQQLIQHAFDEVWSALDTTSLARLHTDDFLLLEHGEVWNNDTIINYQRNELPNMQAVGYKRYNSFDFIETKVSPESVWVAYHNYAVWKIGEEEKGGMHWLESAVAVPTDEGWKLQMLHSTRINREADH